MLGVLAGLKDYLTIGDVVVARDIVGYQSAKITDNGLESRAYHYYAGKIYKLFDVIQDHQFNDISQIMTLIDGKMVKKCKIYKGQVLSGEEILNSKEYKKELKNLHSNAIGLEMEFQGVASACVENDIANILMIKGVCDMGEFKDNPNKDNYQRFAMQQAVRICKIIFNDPLSFQENNLKYSLSRTRNRSVFISGSHDINADNIKIEDFNMFTNKYIDCETAVLFARELSYELAQKGYRIVTGYGKEIGQGVIAGVYQNINFLKPEENSYSNISERILTFPFPRIKHQLYNGFSYEAFKLRYREIMNKEAKFFIAIFGIKIEGTAEKGFFPAKADGVREEFATAHNLGSMVIPVGSTEFISRTLWEEVKNNLDSYYPIMANDKETQENLYKRIELRNAAFAALGEDIDFNNINNRQTLIQSILYFIKKPWEKI
jgi:Nucleoside phosphorylase